MRFLLLTITLICSSAWADTAIRCRQLQGGAYPNSAKNIQTLSLLTYINHFSLANMMVMKLETDTDELVFSRQLIEVTNTTSIRMVQKSPNQKFKLAWLLIDRTPRNAFTTRMFKGVLFISEPLKEIVNQPSDLPLGSVKTYNFECSI